MIIVMEVLRNTYITLEELAAHYEGGEKQIIKEAARGLVTLFADSSDFSRKLPVSSECFKGRSDKKNFDLVFKLDIKAIGDYIWTDKKEIPPGSLRSEIVRDENGFIDLEEYFFESSTQKKVSIDKLYANPPENYGEIVNIRQSGDIWILELKGRQERIHPKIKDLLLLFPSSQSNKFSSLQAGQVKGGFEEHIEKGVQSHFSRLTGGEFVFQNLVSVRKISQRDVRYTLKCIVKVVT